MLAHRQKITALRREGIYLEEEYHEEIRAYMYEMEVCARRLPAYMTRRAEYRSLSA